MAIKVAITSGNFNTAGTWYTGTETNTGGTSTSATFSPATRYSAVFTAPNTTNACVGSYVHINTLPLLASMGTITATLQEYDGAAWNDCAGASAVLTESDLDGYRLFTGSTSISAGFLFKFTTPYVYTTTTAGYYRFKYVRSAALSSSSFYASTVTSEVWSIIVDDRTGAVGSTDVCYIAGVTGAKTTVTLDGACACGQTVTTDGTDYAHIRPDYSSQWAMVIGYMGQVIPDSTQNTTLTINGSSPIVVIGGQLNFGTTAAPHTASYTAKIVYNPKTTYACGFRVYGHNKSLEHFSFVGQTKTYQTNYVSGTGITGSELVVADATGWVVGDLIAFSGDTYNKHEHKYIKTISGTTITLADSVGGAESALANTHYAADWVLNLSRNVGITSSGAGKAWFAWMQCTSTANGVAKYAEFSNIAGNASSRYAFFIARSARYAINYDGCSWYDIVNSFGVGHQWAYGYGSQITDNTYKNCVHYAPVTPLTYCYSLVRLGLLACSKTNITNNYFVGGRYSGVELAGYGAEYNGFHVRNACAGYSSSGTYTGIQMNGGSDVTLTNSTVNATRSNAMSFASGTTNYKVKNSSFGTVYANSASGDIATSAYGAFHTVVFDSCDFTSTGGWVYYVLDTNGYMYDAIGSQFAFQNYDNEAGNHAIYKPDGIIQRTASGLTDTTVRTTGGSCLRFESNNTISRLEWMQHVPVGDVQNKSMTVGVWCKINNANYYAGTKEMPRLTLVYDNGTETYAEATATTDWQFLSMSFTPTTNYPDIILTISAMTDATSTDAYVYFTDFSVLYPAGVQLKLGELRDFADGEPLKPTIATNLSPADVWAVSTSGLTGDGTIGKFVTKLLTVAKFLGLK